MDITNSKPIIKFNYAVYSAYDKTIQILDLFQSAGRADKQGSFQSAPAASEKPKANNTVNRYLGNGELIKDGEIRLLDNGHSIILTGTHIITEYTERSIYRDEVDPLWMKSPSSENKWQWQPPNFFKRIFGWGVARQYVRGWYMTNKTKKIKLILSNYYIIF